MDDVSWIKLMDKLIAVYEQIGGRFNGMVTDMLYGAMRRYERPVSGDAGIRTGGIEGWLIDKEHGYREVERQTVCNMKMGRTEW